MMVSALSLTIGALSLCRASPPKQASPPRCAGPRFDWKPIVMAHPSAHESPPRRTDTRRVVRHSSKQQRARLALQPVDPGFRRPVGFRNGNPTSGAVRCVRVGVDPRFPPPGERMRAAAKMDFGRVGGVLKCGMFVIGGCITASCKGLRERDDRVQRDCGCTAYAFA